MANNNSQDDDIITTANTWSLTNSSKPINLSGFASSTSIVGSFNNLYSTTTNITDSVVFCRKCGKDYHTYDEVFLIPGFCNTCVPTLLEEVFKNTMPKTTEYCQDCFSHFKACKCEKKQALDKIKS